MAQTEARSIFDLYPNMLKTWTDIFNQWPRTVGGFYPGSFKTAGMENWFIPFWGYMEDWTKAYQGLTNMAKSTAAPYESMKEMNEMVAKGINSYVKIYDAWLRSMDSAAREGYAIGQKLMEGEEVDTGSYFDVMRDAYYNTTSSVMEALKDTPFSGMEDIFQKVKNSIEEFSEEQGVAEDFYQEMLSFNAKMINLSTSAMREASKTLADMLEKGTISSDAYKKMMDLYAETLKHSIEIMRPPAALLPGYQEFVDTMITCGEKNLDVISSWLEINLKLYEGIGRSQSEISKIPSEVFKDKESISPNDFYKKWAETWEKSTRVLVESSEVSSSIPSFVRTYSDWMKSFEEVYRSASAVPFTTKEDLESIYEELDRMKATAAKKAKAAV